MRGKVRVLRLSLFLRTLSIFGSESAFLFRFVFLTPLSSLPAYLHVSRPDTQFICELDTIYRRDTVSLCHRVLHTRLLKRFARVSARPSVRPPSAALFTHDYSPALANKPLIFRSPLGTFCHHTTRRPLAAHIIRPLISNTVRF